MEDCIFCKIINGKIPGDFVYKDAEIVVIRDINPLTPTHLLVIPVKHIAMLSDISPTDNTLMGNMIAVANKAAKEQGICESGYRLVVNNGKNAGQLVAHLHIHVLGGRPMSGNFD
ncbi:MAG: histidine triad nucleotide-binding protein [Dehalococcoidales bacterium]|nr:histidine triad nucleotide-binding protein [Dehalococcoidales bacterium]